MTPARQAASLLLAIAALATAPTRARSPEERAPDLHPGLELLLHRPLSVEAMTLEELASLWQVWEGDDRAAAEAATPVARRELIYARYGLIERGPELGRGIEATLPLGYTADDDGRLYPNCLVCHGGKVAGQVVAGIANTEQDLSGMVRDLASLRAMRSPGETDIRGMLSLFPLNFSRGTTNATMYSILLGAMRDKDLNQVMPPQFSQPFVHNSIDAPPWWHFRKKSRIYWDGMAPKSTRTLMQFTMAPGLSGDRIRSWEDEFETIRSFIESVPVPRYPFAVDEQLASKGRLAFERVCSACHGTYGESSTYPERTIPIDEIGTDPIRHRAIQPASKKKYNEGWFSNYGEHPVEIETRGYVAPPLDGIWATAPYLHNASVPTLWHVLHPNERPAFWRRLGTDDYDETRVGLAVEQLESVPGDLSERERRKIYDTGLASQGAAGHRFPEKLTERERLAVLEYLKTL